MVLVNLAWFKPHQYKLYLDHFISKANIQEWTGVNREPCDGELQGQVSLRLLEVSVRSPDAPNSSLCWHCELATPTRRRQEQSALWFTSLGYLFTSFLTHTFHHFCNHLSHCFRYILPLPFTYRPTGETRLNGEVYPIQQTIQDHAELSSKSFSSFNSPHLLTTSHLIRANEWFFLEFSFSVSLCHLQ